jgi:addiction module HigA family antidote
LSNTILSPVHFGEVLHEEFMVPLGISINALARDLNVAPNRISQIVDGASSITAEMVLRLSVFFGTTAQSWVNLQALYDLEVARLSKARQIKSEVRKMSRANRW